MSVQDTLVHEQESLRWELDPASRTHRLREMYWAKAHEAARVTKPIAGCGEDTLVGHARDFAALLAASDPAIQPDERIVGCSLAVPEDPEALNLGHYDPHYPPGLRSAPAQGAARHPRRGAGAAGDRDATRSGASSCARSRSPMTRRAGT